MRIISSFSDYYDAVMKMGMDKDIVYVRETKLALINDEYEVYTRHSSDHSVYLQYLGFCGQIYKIYIIKIGANYERIFYDFDEFAEEALRVGAANKYDFGRRWWKGPFERFAEESTTSLQEFFHKYQVPIFLIKDSQEKNKQKLVLNPNLKNIKFQTIRDPYSAYQDIFQYVSGVLNSPENKMVKISDKDKISKHGYDKWSFRKLPTKKK